VKHNSAISFAHDMAERSRPSEKARRPTAIDDVMWRFAERRAEELGVDFRELVTKLSSRPTEWRARAQGATPQLLQKVEARLAEIEEERGVASSRAALLKAWSEMGAELLMIDDDGKLFKEMLESARDVLAAARKLDGAMNAFRKK
jgi:hypothetical protein